MDALEDILRALYVESRTLRDFDAYRRWGGGVDADMEERGRAAEAASARLKAELVERIVRLRHESPDLVATWAGHHAALTTGRDQRRWVAIRDGEGEDFPTYPPAGLDPAAYESRFGRPPP